VLHSEARVELGGELNGSPLRTVNTIGARLRDNRTLSGRDSSNMHSSLGRQL